MFRKTHKEELVNETENSEHCFIVLKKHEIKSYGDEYETYYGGMGLNFKNFPFYDDDIYAMLSSPNRTSNFSFHKELDAKPDSRRSLYFAVDCGFEIRVSIKINMSLDQLNALLDSTYFNYHGVNTKISKRKEEVRKILEHSLMNSYVDIKDKNTHEWYRIETNEFNKKYNFTCPIL